MENMDTHSGPINTSGQSSSQQTISPSNLSINPAVKCSFLEVLKDFQDQTPNSKRQNIEPILTETIRIEVSKVIATFLSISFMKPVA